jgi:hypothetical protein
VRGSVVFYVCDLQEGLGFFNQFKVQGALSMLAKKMKVTKNNNHIS